jgi:hypothetical protein
MNIIPHPETILQLQKEINKNPQIQMYMMENVDADDDAPTRLGKLAAYFNIECDGYYELPAICEVLLKECIKANSTSIIIQ